MPLGLLFSDPLTGLQLPKPSKFPLFTKQLDGHTMPDVYCVVTRKFCVSKKEKHVFLVLIRTTPFRGVSVPYTLGSPTHLLIAALFE